MSATFWCPEAPRALVKRPCDMRGCVEGNRCGYCQEGILEEMETECPEMNIANQNAQALLHILKVPSSGGETPDGSWSVMEIPHIRRRITMLRNSETGRSPATWPGTGRQQMLIVKDDDGTPRLTPGARHINCGSSDDQVMLRLEKLDALLAYAQEHGYGVSWG